MIFKWGTQNQIQLQEDNPDMLEWEGNYNDYVQKRGFFLAHVHMHKTSS